jgi:hypothetical protein
MLSFNRVLFFNISEICPNISIFSFEELKDKIWQLPRVPYKNKTKIQFNNLLNFEEILLFFCKKQKTKAKDSI